MKNPSLMTRFVESGFKPVEFDGELVHPMYRADLREGNVVRVTWISAGSPRVQGLALRLRKPGVTGAKGRGGLLRVEASEAPTIYLWMDTAPPVVDATCVRLAVGGEFQVTNRWRLPDGSEDEGLNNFGIKVERESDDSAVLHCSDGYGAEPSFTDLVVRIEVVSSPSG